MITRLKKQFKEFAKECPTLSKIFGYLLIAGIIAMEAGIIITIS